MISPSKDFYKDYYALLGVPRLATAKEIKRAYRKQAKKYHPDVSNRADANMMFQRLVKAYSVLKDKKKRAEYNNKLMTEYFQKEVINPARKRFSGIGASRFDADFFDDK